MASHLLKTHDVPLEEAADLWGDAGEGEMDVGPAAAEITTHQQRAVDIHKFHTLNYQRRTKQKVVTDYATVSKGLSSNIKPRAALRQVLFHQGVAEKSSTPEEQGQLDRLKQALGAFSVPMCLRWSWGEVGERTTLENSWTEIVHSHMTMCKTQKHQQEALWEFVHTELAYINKLTIVTELVMAALTNLHQHGFLQEVTHELLFSNLPSILAAHRHFWQEVTYPMLQEVRMTGKPFDPLRLEAGCLQFHGRFSSYLQYCWEEESTIEFTRNQLETNHHFNAFVKWVETHPQCERMRLGDMQAKPHQRITKYPLLLKAVIKTTQDPVTQHRLRGMLTSVNGFLDSINDYMRLKDEELALSISAQRVEGYDVMEGMTEEIDKHVREFCRFDLTAPVRGVGPGVIRKLLLEQTLKIRGRKDNKLEVVTLLFSDMLLVTKAQKKAERLKVVRPPLALDRARCAPLKDGCSFVLVEVSDLGCAVNVYSFLASNSESCSKWVSNIQQAQETLEALREMEGNRKLEADEKHQQLEITSPIYNNVSSGDMVEVPSGQSECVCKDLRCLEVTSVEEPPVIQSVNGTLSSMAKETNTLPKTPGPNNSDCQGTGLQGRQRRFIETHSQSLHRGFAGWAMKKEQGERAIEKEAWSESGLKWDRGSNQLEEKNGLQLKGITERRVTWNHDRPSSTSDLNDNFPSQGKTGTFKTKPNWPSLFPGEYPDIDYLPARPSAFLFPSTENQPKGSEDQINSQESQDAERSHLNSESLKLETENKPRASQSEEEAPTESWRFSRKLKSPRLRRRRPIGSTQNMQPEMPRRGSEPVAWSVAQTNHASNSDFAGNRKLPDTHGSSGQSTDSHLVLKLGSLKQNREDFWYMGAGVESPDSETVSDTELPKVTPHEISQKRPKLRTQRSMSNPDIIIPDQMLTTSRLPRLDIPHSPPPSLDPLLHPSPLEGLLMRAKERKKDLDGGKTKQQRSTSRDGLLDLSPSPSFSTTTSHSPSEGDRETEWEEVFLIRHRAPTVSQGWREDTVDGSEEENKSCTVFPDGSSVDWPGWCFDDDEVMDYLSPEEKSHGNESLLEVITQTLTLRDSQSVNERKKGEVSHV